MDTQTIKNITKTGAILTLIGSVCMLTGAALLVISGADMDLALETNNIAAYIDAVNANETLVILNLSLWILGVILIGAGASLMISLSNNRPVWSRIAQYNYHIAIPIVVISYMVWLSVIVSILKNDPDELSFFTESIGWLATKADWVATFLVLGIGPLLISLSGKDHWIPSWLFRWSYVCLIAGTLNVIAMYVGGLTTYGFLVIPVGMGWMIAVSVILFKRSFS
jgi:hypothetical protein